MSGSRRGALFAVLVALPIALGGCDSATSSSQQPGTAAPAGSSAGQSAGPASSAEQAPPEDFVTGPGDVFLADGADGLEALSSYSATMTVTFEGTSGGAPSSWTSTSSYAYVSDVGETLTVEQPSDQPAIFPAWSAHADGVDYARSAGGDCAATLPEDGGAPEPSPDPEDPLQPPARNPAARLPGFVGAEVTGQETVAGVAADVATLTPAALGWPADTRATGTVAIATTGDYVLRYDLVLEAGPEVFGDGVSGKLTRHYELSDIGSATIVIPADCPAGLIQGPQPVDAVTVASLPGFLSLTTTGSVEDTAALYRDTSLAFGWHVVGDTTINQDLGALRFTADGLEISVAINAISGGSRIEVVASRS